MPFRGISFPLASLCRTAYLHQLILVVSIDAESRKFIVPATGAAAAKYISGNITGTEIRRYDETIEGVVYGSTGFCFLGRVRK